MPIELPAPAQWAVKASACGIGAKFWWTEREFAWCCLYEAAGEFRSFSFTCPPMEENLFERFQTKRHRSAIVYGGLMINSKAIGRGGITFAVLKKGPNLFCIMGENANRKLLRTPKNHFGWPKLFIGRKVPLFEPWKAIAPHKAIPNF